MSVWTFQIFHSLLTVFPHGSGNGNAPVPTFKITLLTFSLEVWFPPPINLTLFYPTWQSPQPSLWWGRAMRSIWNGGLPLSTATSSALSCLSSCLPSCCQVVSESHPAAICYRLGLPPLILGGGNNAAPSPLCSRSQHGGPVSSLPSL